MQQNQEYTKFGRQVGYTITAQVISLLLTLIQLPILTRGLGNTLYGTWALINVTISLITPFAVLSLGNALIRFLAAEKDKSVIGKDFFSTCSIVFFAGTVLSALMFLLAGSLAEFVFKDAGASHYIRLASILILLYSFNDLALNFIRMLRMIGLYTILNLAKFILQLGLVVLFLHLGYKLDGVIYATIIGLVTLDLIVLVIVLSHIGFQVPSFSHMSTYLKWGIPLTPNEAMLWMIQASDRYLVSYFLGVAKAGIFNAAYNIGQFASFAMMPVSIVLYPNAVKTYDEGRQNETRKYLKYSTKYLMMVAIPSAFACSILAKPLLQILTTPDFISGSTVVAFSAFGAVFYCFYQICFYIINIVNKTYLTIRLLVTAAIVNVGLNIVLIPRLGLQGAALATLVACGVLGILTLVVSRRYLKFDLSLTFIAKSILASSVMTLCIWLVNPESLSMVLVSIVLGITIYFAVLMLIKGLGRGEIAFFINFAKDNLKGISNLK